MSALLLCSIALFSACQEDATKANKDLNNIASEQVNHIKYGFIGYEVLDGEDLNEQDIQMLTQALPSLLTTEVVYDENRAVELFKKDGKYVRYSLFDRVKKTHYELLNTTENNWYSEIAADEKNFSADNDFEEIAEHVVIDPNSVNINGYNCKKISIIDTSSFDRFMLEAYVASDIPHIFEALAPLNKHVDGAPIQISFKEGPLLLTFGVIEKSYNSELAKYLDFDKSKYQKLSRKGFSEKRNAHSDMFPARELFR